MCIGYITRLLEVHGGFDVISGFLLLKFIMFTGLRSFE